MKSNPLVAAVLCLSLFLYSIKGLAGGDHNSTPLEHNKMHVQIDNETSTRCRLDSYQLIHGVLRSAPPSAIMLGDSKAFDMEQRLGPDIRLTYYCADNKISFEVQQDLSLFFGHAPTVTILAAQGLILKSTTQSGSTLWNNSGMATIQIEPAGVP